MAIGIVADRGQPAKDVAVALRRLRNRGVVNSAGDDDAPEGSVEVDVVTGTIPMTEDGDVELNRYAPTLRASRGWDKLIYVTDLPVTALNRPVLSQYSDNGDILLSTPSYGMFRARYRIGRELESLLAGEGPVYGTERVGESEGAAADDDGGDPALARVRVLDTWGRTPRLVGGMLRANQPGSLLPVMTGSLAAMAATGGFGVFYGSIWNLSEAVGVWRLLLLSLGAIVVLSAWLILRNRLWVRRGTQQSRWRENLDNIVTVLTISVTVLIMFVLAAVGMMLLSVLVVPLDYLREQIEGEATWSSYLRIGWLAASLGTFAGAVGSNFDRQVEIRSATYTRREYERRRKVGERIEEAEREEQLSDDGGRDIVDFMYDDD